MNDSIEDEGLTVPTRSARGDGDERGARFVGEHRGLPGEFRRLWLRNSPIAAWRALAANAPSFFDAAVAKRRHPDPRPARAGHRYFTAVQSTCRSGTARSACHVAASVSPDAASPRAL